MTSKRASQYASCRRHRPFRTYEAALAHYVEKVARGEADPGQAIYRCAGCGRWHHGGGNRSLGRLMEETASGDRAAREDAR